MRLTGPAAVAALVGVAALPACASRAGSGTTAPAPVAGSVTSAPFRDPAPEVPYLSRAHSHNNYDQPRPLLDALGRGFASIEVDVVLVDGTLYVAHAFEDVRPSRTLSALYLDPLREIVRRNGGTVYGARRPPLQLLVDVKSDPDSTYDVLEGVLGDYADILTVWTDGAPTPGAVSVVLSGNRAMERIGEASLRRVAIDGRLFDERAGLPPAAMPLVSADWEDLGPETDAGRLDAVRDMVAVVHSEGRKVRLWATPEDEDLWRSLIAIGVDYIGTDDPTRLQRLLQEIEGEPRDPGD